MKNAHVSISIAVFLLSLLTCYTNAATGLAATNSRDGATIRVIAAEPEIAAISVSVSNEIRAAVNRSLDWLAGRQSRDGSWSEPHHPALTALPAMAFMKSAHRRRDHIVSNAIKHIISCVRNDGGIYIKPTAERKGGLEVFNTAVCTTALHMNDRNTHDSIISKARRFLAGRQHFGDDIYKGGFGYYEDSASEYVHGLDTFYSMQAIAVTEPESTNSTAPDSPSVIDWSETVSYFTKRQGRPPSLLPAAPEFAYSPGPGSNNAKTNNIYFHSYGSMTYIGLLALVYADIDSSDVRVRSAFDWAKKHWSLKENPGKGREGLYFFYYVLARALSEYGIDLINTSDGDLINWRADLAKRLLSLQRFDDKGNGFWKNNTSRFWENDPVLCTSYAVLTLQMVLPSRGKPAGLK